MRPTIRLSAGRLRDPRSPVFEKLLKSLRHSLLALLICAIHIAIPSEAVAQELQTRPGSRTEFLAGIVGGQDTPAELDFSPSGTSFERYCLEPSPPYGGPPTPPYCSPSSSCSSWEVDNFRAEVEDYIDDMEQYLHEAQEFANCRVEEAIDNWNSFLSEY